MWAKAGHFVIEFLFVIGTIMLLKNWVFPLLISFWFPVRFVAEQFLEWTMIIIGVMMIFIYLGLGSSGKYSYHLPLLQAIAVFIGLHLLFFIPVFSIVDQFYMYWEYLFRDFFSLFFPKKTFNTWQFVIIYFVLYLVGRKIRVKDEKIELISGNKALKTRLKVRDH